MESDPFSHSPICQAIDSVGEFLTQEKEWSTTNFPVEFAFDHDDTKERQVINMVNHMDFNVRHTLKKKKDEDLLWLPKHLNDNSEKGRQELLNHFSRPALLCGFGLRLRGRKENSVNTVTLVCDRARYYSPSKKKKPQATTTSSDKKVSTTDKKVSTTSKPIKGRDQACPFRINVYYDPDQKRFYIPSKTSGCSHHCGHIRLTPDIAPARKEDLDPNELAILVDCAQARMKLSSLDKMCMKRNAFTLSQGRLEYLRKSQKQVVDDPRISSHIGGHRMNNPKTPADRLLAHFDEQEDSSYVALYADFGTERLTIRKKCKYRANHSLTDVPVSECKDNVSSARHDAEKVRNSITSALKVTAAKGKILLAFCWTDEESRLRFDMFPELIAADCVAKLNREERPVMHWSAVDSRNKTFTFTWGFLPSESQWTFEWIVRNVLPHLHNERTLDKVQVLLTDQDGQLNDVISANTGSGTVLPNAKHRLCAWHKLDRNLTSSTKYTGKLHTGGVMGDCCQAEWNAIVSWLWMLTRDTETEYESNLLLTLLQCYLSEDTSHHKGHFSSELKTLLADFISSSFQGRHSKLFNHHFIKLLDFFKITTSLVEAENSAAKTHSYAPNPRDHLDEAQLKMEERTVQRHRERRRRSADDLRRVPTKVEDREQSVLELTKFISDFLWGEKRNSVGYDMWSIDKYTCYVRFYDYKDSPDFDLDGAGAIGYELRRSLRKSYVLPHFQRTRVVRLVYDETSQVWVLTCSCGVVPSMGACCRHIYAVTGHLPWKFDARFRWWREFDIVCLGSALSDQLRSKIVDAAEKSSRLAGIITTLRELPRRKPNHAPEWFEETLTTPRIRATGYWATEQGKSLLSQAEFQVRTHGQGGVMPFGTIEEVASGDVKLFGLTEKELSKIPNKGERKSSSKVPPSSSSHLDETMIENILKRGSHGSFQSLYAEICGCANNKERVEILWHGLQSTHEQLLTSIRNEEAKTGNRKNMEGGTLSGPSIMSGKKRSNARTKRMEDIVRDKSAKKKKKENH